jgi:hypothetical protein
MLVTINRYLLIYQENSRVPRKAWRNGMFKKVDHITLLTFSGEHLDRSHCDNDNKTPYSFHILIISTSLLSSERVGEQRSKRKRNDSRKQNIWWPSIYKRNRNAAVMTTEYHNTISYSVAYHDNHVDEVRLHLWPAATNRPTVHPIGDIWAWRTTVEWWCR